MKKQASQTADPSVCRNTRAQRLIKWFTNFQLDQGLWSFLSSIDVHDPAPWLSTENVKAVIDDGRSMVSALKLGYAEETCAVKVVSIYSFVHHWNTKSCISDLYLNVRNKTFLSTYRQHHESVKMQVEHLTEGVHLTWRAESRRQYCVRNWKCCISSVHPPFNCTEVTSPTSICRSTEFASPAWELPRLCNETTGVWPPSKLDYPALNMRFIAASMADDAGSEHVHPCHRSLKASVVELHQSPTFKFCKWLRRESLCQMQLDQSLDDMRQRMQSDPGPHHVCDQLFARLQCHFYDLSSLPADWQVHPWCRCFLVMQTLYSSCRLLSLYSGSLFWSRGRLYSSASLTFCFWSLSSSFSCCCSYNVMSMVLSCLLSSTLIISLSFHSSSCRERLTVSESSTCETTVVKSGAISTAK